MEMNARGEKPDDLQGYAIVEEAAPEDALYGDVVGQDDVGRFDTSGRRRSKGKGGRHRNRSSGGSVSGQSAAATTESDGSSSSSGAGGKRRKKRRKGRGPGNPPQG